MILLQFVMNHPQRHREQRDADQITGVRTEIHKMFFHAAFAHSLLIAVFENLCKRVILRPVRNYTGFINLLKNFGTGASKAIRFPLCG